MPCRLCVISYGYNLHRIAIVSVGGGGATLPPPHPPPYFPADPEMEITKKENP
jgi:hypothetical protein